MAVDYSAMTEEQLNLINEYCENDMKKLKQICYVVWGKKGISTCYHDDLYSDAMKVLSESVVTFNPNGKAKFKTYLAGNMQRSYKDWYRDTFLRAKRNNLEQDKNGNIKRDENGNPTTISNISFDAPTDDDIDLCEKIASDYNVEEESTLDFNTDDNVEIFLSSLSKKQRKIIEMKINGFSVDEIKDELNLSNAEYSTAMKSIKMNENLSLFSKNINDCDYKEENDMERVMEVNESENYRTDKYSMYSLLDDKKSGNINCKYILQRKPFQWTQEERNRYICRLLCNLPIPEIVLCEQIIKGMNIANLIDGLQRLSYAEAFKENRFKIGANGAERHLIKYKEFLVDENGNRVLDEDGIPVYEEKICDVVGKYYKDLPEDLKKRFNNFNVNVTKFFNCTDEQIADHIRDYNNHASMNNEQLGMTKISADTARSIKTIAEKNTFFKNCGKYTDSNKIKGKVDRIVAEAIMLLFHRDEWKSKLDKAYQYIDENATEAEFYELNSDLNRLEIALGEDNKELMDMFTPTNTPMWLAVFHEFITYDLDDSKFIEFLTAYKNGLNEKEVDGVSMKDFKDMQTKKKTTITGKIDLLVKLMRDFLHIEDEIETEDTEETEETNEENVNNTAITSKDILKEFVANNITDDDIELYELIANDKSDAIEDLDSWMLSDQNRTSFVALVGYATRKEIEDELDEWLPIYERDNTYISNPKQNYLHMVNDFDKFCERKVA